MQLLVRKSPIEIAQARYLGIARNSVRFSMISMTDNLK